MSTSETANSGTVSAAASALIGRTLDGRFLITKAIGQGSMGTVFLAKQLSIDRLVAVKVLRPDLSPLSKTRFMREARVISAIAHPNIVSLFEFAHHADEGLLYFAMEYIDGLRLSRINRMGRLHPNLVIELCIQICSALAEAHSHMVIHRDLKPSNMMVRLQADGSVRLKVLDFGVARTLEGMEQLTADGVLCGTPSYMAPEQAKGGEVTVQTDLYALGVNLYEMLAGFRPIRGSTPIETAVKQVQQQPDSLRSYVDSGLIPLGLVNLAEELLQKDPSKRPVSAIDVRRRLLELRGTLGWSPIVFEDPSDAVWIHWARPRLGVDDGAGADDSWGTALSAGDLAKKSAVPQVQRTPSDASVSEDSMPSRAGGGWDAFKETPSEARQGAVDPMVEAQVGDSSGAETVPVRGVEPPKPRPKPTPKPSIQRTVAPAKLSVSQELVPDRPARQGTTINDMPRRRTSTADMIRFVLVTVATFVVVAAGFFYFIGARSEPEPRTQPEFESPSTPDPEPVVKKTAKKKKARKATTNVPIDLFGDAPPDAPDKAPILFEEGAQ